jgi:competence protein ComEC
LGLVLSAISKAFSLINYGLFTVLTIIEFIQKMLGMLLPEIIYFSYIESLVVFGLYICYVGIKKGYVQFKYLPLCFVFILLFQNYKVFPEISYISVHNNDIVLLQYKKNTIAVTAGNIDVQDIKVPVKIDKVIEGYKENGTMRLTDKYMIRLISHGNKLEAQVCFLEKANKNADHLVFNNNQQEIKEYKDTIVLKRDETYTPPGTIINKFIIIGNKILKFSQGLEEVL